MASTKSWQVSLDRLLSQARLKAGGRPCIAVMGIGNEFRADDAAGMLVVGRLRTYGCVFEEALICLIQAGQSPENCTWKLRSFEPHLILLVDAADMGELPGTVRLIPIEDISGLSACTHSLPLSMLANYLTQDLNCQVALLGIQPASVTFGGPVNLEVLQAVDEIVKEFGVRFSRGEAAPASVEAFRGGSNA